MSTSCRLSKLEAGLLNHHRRATQPIFSPSSLRRKVRQELDPLAAECSTVLAQVPRDVTRCDAVSDIAAPEDSGDCSFNGVPI